MIPTVGRHRILERLLDRLAAQTAPSGDFRVIVVDDPFADDPRAVAQAIGERPYAVRQVSSRAERNVSAARNRGLEEVGAPLVLFLGDDILPEPGLVAAHLAAHDRHPEEEAGVLGHVGWADGLPLTPFMRWMAWSGRQFDFASIPGERAGWWHFYTANVSVKPGMVARAGGFDEAFPFGQEDGELAYRMEQLGFELFYEPAASAGHWHRQTLEDYERRMRMVGDSERRLVAKHPAIPPFHRRWLQEAVDAGPGARGRGERLARLVPPGLPVLGPRVWASYDLAIRRRLAPHFFAGWEEAEAAAAAQPLASSGGSPPGGPK